MVERTVGGGDDPDLDAVLITSPQSPYPWFKATKKLVAPLKKFVERHVLPPPPQKIEKNKKKQKKTKVISWIQNIVDSKKKNKQ